MLKFCTILYRKKNLSKKKTHKPPHKPHKPILWKMGPHKPSAQAPHKPNLPVFKQLHLSKKFKLYTCPNTTRTSRPHKPPAQAAHTSLT